MGDVFIWTKTLLMVQGSDDNRFLTPSGLCFAYCNRQIDQIISQSLARIQIKARAHT